MGRLWGFIKNEWATLSTKLGTLAIAVSSVAPGYAAFDHRIAYAGLAFGVLAILYPGKKPDA